VSRPALALLPRHATTAIGSLPHTQGELGLQLALQLDVPFLPELPAGNSGEYMMASALEGLPGLDFDSQGMCTVQVGTWEAGAAAFGARLDAALASGALSAFQPSAQARRAWLPFLWEIQARHLVLAKAQLAGPATVRWGTQLDGGGPVSDHPALDRQVFRLLLARSLAMVKALRAAGATPLFYLDEPGLYALDTRDGRHLLMLQELRLLVVALQREGALVGLHCCGNTRWEALLGLGLDLLSFDVRLSLDALLDVPGPLEAFLSGGGALSLGVVPTDLGEDGSVVELVAAAETSLESVLGRARAASTLARGADACLRTGPAHRPGRRAHCRAAAGGPGRAGRRKARLTRRAGRFGIAGPGPVN
jgi:hypothetical protein